MTAYDPHKLLRGTAPVATAREPFESPKAGRSTLLRAGLCSPGRKRAYLRRSLVVAILLSAVGALMLAVAVVWFSPDGPARSLYLLHDNVWLPLRGHFWVAPFPGGLVWLVPLLTVLALVLVEFLGIASPLRRAQVAGISLALNGRMGTPLVLWDEVLRQGGGRAGQVRAVAIEMRDAARSKVVASIAFGQGKAPTAALLHFETVVLRLSEGTQADLVSALEILCLARLAGEEGGATLADKIVEKAGLEATQWRDWTEDCRRGVLDLRSALVAADAMASEPIAATPAAVQTLQVALAATLQRHPGHLTWFDSWARQRAGRDPARSAELARAETLIDFEFWAAQAEGRVERPAQKGLLAEAFQDYSGPRNRGEVFARSGESPQNGGRG